MKHKTTLLELQKMFTYLMVGVKESILESILFFREGVEGKKTRVETMDQFETG